MKIHVDRVAEVCEEALLVGLWLELGQQDRQQRRLVRDRELGGRRTLHGTIHPALRAH